MTDTRLRPPTPPAATVRPPAGPAAAQPAGRSESASRLTLLALVGAALGLTPMRQMFTDFDWLFDAWVTMALIVGPAALLRRRRGRATPLELLPGLVLAALWLIARLLSDHAVAGVLPGAGTGADLSAALHSLHLTISTGVAPVHTDRPVTLGVCAVAAVLAVLVDVLAVQLHRAAAAGVPLLVVYTASGAVPREPVSWLLFVAAGCGYLILLSLDARRRVAGWGRLIGRPQRSDVTPRAALGTRVTAVSALRIGAFALAVAVIVPLVIPSTPRNTLSDALHNSSSHNGSASGFGANATSLNAFAALKGNLQRGTPRNLMTVTVGGLADKVQAGYLRANVLSTFTPQGWRAGTHDKTPGLDDLSTSAEDSSSSTTSFYAQVSIDALKDNPPIFDRPRRIGTANTNCSWSPTDQIVLGCTAQSGDSYTELVRQPDPTVADLESSPADYPRSLAPLMDAAEVPDQVTRLVRGLTDRADTPYDKVIAIQDYFSAANGFVYSLDTKQGDSGSDLLDFLENKQGFCQQYAGAMAIMVRSAGIPARVVLGYTHPVPNSAGQFTVTTNDAHAWVEVYFNGLGWVPFDPTPLEGIDGGSAADLPWAPHHTSTVAPKAPDSIDKTAGDSSSAAGTSSGANSSSAGAAAAQNVGRTPGSGTAMSLGVVLGLLAVLVLAAALLVPGVTRRLRRRQRFAAARGGDPEALWAELEATAVDLGVPWSSARTPRQTVSWLQRQFEVPPDSGLAALAAAVEAKRYAPGSPDADTEAMRSSVLAAEAALRSRSSARTRWTALLAPKSLGLRLPLPHRWARLRGRHV